MDEAFLWDSVVSLKYPRSRPRSGHVTTRGETRRGTSTAGTRRRRDGMRTEEEDGTRTEEEDGTRTEEVVMRTREDGMRTEEDGRRSLWELRKMLILVTVVAQGRNQC